MRAFSQKGVRSKGFAALIVTQFLGAFNDNAFKFVIAMIAIDRFSSQMGGTLYLSLSGAAFLLPFLFFSTYAGFLADRFSKQTIIVGTKMAELLIMSLGLLSLMHGGIWTMLMVLFLAGAQSAFFSPSKYGILPEILPDEELSRGNGIIQLFTNAAIILGTASAGVLVQWSRPDIYKTAYFFITIALIGILTSLRVTKVRPAGSTRAFQWNVLGDVIRNIQKIRSNRAIFLAIMGLVYFGFLGALFQLNILLYAKNVLGMNDVSTSLLFVILTVGIGLGACAAGWLSSGKVELGLVPMGAIGLSFFPLGLGFFPHSMVFVYICLFLTGLSAGFYVVPLNALIQQKSPVDQKGLVLATNNFLSFAAMLVGSGLLYVLRDLFHLNAAHIFIVMGVLTIFATAYICALLPYALIRFVLWVLTHSLYRIQVTGHGQVPEKGGALLVSNHVTYVDALLISSSLQRPVRFLISKKIYQNTWLNPLFRLARSIPVDDKGRPKEIVRALNTAREAVKNNELVCIFPEGQLTRTGNFLKFQKGFEHIMKDADYPIIPVHLDGVWGSIFSYEGGKYYWKIPKILPYPVTVSFGESMPSASTAFEARQEVMKLGAEAFHKRLGERDILPISFWKEARRHPWKFCIADSSGKRLNYGITLIAAVALAGTLRLKLKDENKIGIILPPSVGGVLVNIALAILNKTAVNMNYTSSEETIKSIAGQCGMKYVISSRKFLEKVQIQVPGNMMDIEDIMTSIRPVDKIVSGIKTFLLPSVFSRIWIFGKKTRRDNEDLATVMFTSGSTGEPKGVMLTHSNIRSNLEGLYQVFHTKNNDVLVGILPLFHSFGYTGTMWFPLIAGIGAVYHYNPLDARVVGKLTEKYQATILMATPTFLNAYTRRCSENQFKSLRVVVVGAEKLKETVADTFQDKFGIEPMEGYGCTELSPIVAINVPDPRGSGRRQKTHKKGKIGLPLPGVAVQVVDPDTREPLGPEEDGLFFVKGANVMKGYLHQPGKTSEVIKDGWYETGDIGNMDQDGFLKITDRLSRFSKIGGEMVPHVKVEEKIHEILGAEELMCVVTSVPDEKKGEKLVVLCLPDVNIPGLVEELKNRDMPKLWIPDARDFIKVESFPLLGTGKLDLKGIKRVAQERDCR